MKLFQSALFRSLIAIVIGGLLVEFGYDSLLMLIIALPILGAIHQFIRLIEASRIDKISLGFWLSPIAIILTGVVAILRPDMLKEPLDMLHLIGWMLLVYGVVECIVSVKIHLLNKKAEQDAQLIATPAEESETNE